MCNTKTINGLAQDSFNTSFVLFLPQTVTHHGINHY